MTGGEAAAAAMVGKVVQHAGEQLVEEHKNVKQELLSVSKDSPHMARAANDYAKGIALRQAIVTKAYVHIAKWFGVAKEYFDDDFNKEMAEKLQDVPEENIVAPKPSLAAPAMQHLAYSLDEPNLKDMYLSLLATASDDRRSDNAHPSFVEVIKQLSSDETALLNYVLLSGPPVPIVTFVIQTSGVEGQSTFQKHVLQTINTVTKEVVEIPKLAAYVDNWVRLGLVEVSYSSYVTRPGAYDWALERPEARRRMAVLEENETFDLDKGFIRSTDFGKAFAEAVGIATD